MRVVLLAGGKGTRLSEETSYRPKPMVEIGGVPILVHIMRWYAAAGHNHFVIACGHLGTVIKEYFASYRNRLSDFTIDLADGSVEYHSGADSDWVVTVVDTGADTMTGGRLARLADHVGDETFMMTYGDGLGNVDLHELVETHRRFGRLATVTAVRPPARFGSLVFDHDNQVTAFAEKVQGSEAYINGGFFVLEPEVMQYVGDDAMPFERDPLERLAAEGQLSYHQHDGFWRPMDTLRDRNDLEAIWDHGDAPWKP